MAWSKYLRCARLRARPAVAPDRGTEEASIATLWWRSGCSTSVTVSWRFRSLLLRHQDGRTAATPSANHDRGASPVYEFARYALRDASPAIAAAVPARAASASRD